MIDEQKKRFAELLIMTGDPHMAASDLFEDDPDMMLVAATEWPDDDFVKSLIESFGCVNELPTKQQMVKRLVNRLDRGDMEDKDYTAMARLVAEMCGHIAEKPVASVNITNSAEHMDVKIDDINDVDAAANEYKKMIGAQSDTK